jgi:hypothetical protein
VPHLGDAEDRQQRQGRTAPERDGLGDEHDRPAREPVGDHASEGAEHERRAELQRHGEPDERQVASEFQHQPVDGDAGHPHGDAREEDRGHHESEVAHPEDGDDVASGGAPGLDRDRCGESRVTAAETHRSTPSSV